ncbi:hypothetical protein ACM16X_02365 [Haloarcula japonica]|uniref:hypothetical protein n=1 Tax=Haloarcula japonica TaxID=29282 RepID=UPI0039F72A11
MAREIDFVHQHPPAEFLVNMEEAGAKAIRDVLHQAQKSEDVELNYHARLLLNWLNNELPVEFDGFAENSDGKTGTGQGGRTGS